MELLSLTMNLDLSSGKIEYQETEKNIRDF